MSTTSSSSAATSKTTMVYKGKQSRSWQQLPPEVIRLIATHYLYELSATNYYPGTWEQRYMYQNRNMYAVLRDAVDLERLYICPLWHSALETHNFWQHAIFTIDPHSVLTHLAVVQTTATAGSTNVGPVRLTPRALFRTITSRSCVVCRVNWPQTNKGLMSARRMMVVPELGAVAMCRGHGKSGYCGVCLREAPVMEGEAEMAAGTAMCCVENEDNKTWPGVEATCRMCRSEWLWRRVAHSAFDRDAVGGYRWNSADWETRQSVEAFIDLGEGTIGEVVTLAQEKHWLRLYTKLPDMLQQALAASRYVSRAEAGDEYGSEDELSEEEEDDPELMSITEDAGGVRDIAINDWARTRILDGHWISPADQWYGFASERNVVPAEHPCPWHPGSLYSGALEDGESECTSDGEMLMHPRPKTYQSITPPSFALCDQAFRAFRQQMRDILLPAMKNIVRRVVIESTADGIDPTVRTAPMTLEDVVRELREEATWLNGVDWLERRALVRERERAQRQRKDEDDSSTSSRSDGSHTTSPVLSTTTLQTTPSPPPSGSASAKDDDSVASPITTTAPAIPISPVLKSPEPLHPIPYIPVTISHMPQWSLSAFEYVWREACAPLYHCRCSICERAILRANLKASVEAGTVVPSQVQQVPATDQQVTAVTQEPVEIRIQDFPADLVQEEEEEDEEEDGESEKGDDTSVPESPPRPPALPITPRKRRSKELDADAFSDAAESDEYSRSTHNRSVTPPSARLRKRSSEDLEDDDGPALQAGNGDAKRLRADRAVPTTMPVTQKPSKVAAVVDASG
ncbi:hypothetical protein AcV7_006167 [Taiwanofungus camphoratus]|nr:hypothetical protein AcV7_006167 [Antrodia cinnamomea]